MPSGTGRLGAFMAFIGTGSVLALATASAVLCLASGPASAEPPKVTCSLAETPMRDGTLLHAEIYQPATPGRHPVIVTRNPYGLLGDGCFQGGFGSRAAEWARLGYVSILQQTRGTRFSQGVFHPFFQEQTDGYDTIEWAAAQPWSNGKVATAGGSYLGVTEWQPALLAPPHLVAITPGITASDYRDDWVGRNGVPDLLFNRNWGLLWVTDAIRRRMVEQHAAPSEIDQQIAAWTKQAAQNKNWQWSLPLAGDWGDTQVANTGLTIRQLAPQNWEWAAHPTYDSYWATIDVEQQWGKVVAPALVSGGWYDLFSVGTIRNFAGMRAHGGSELARKGAMLVMDCCGHGLPYQSLPGTINWGPDRTNIQSLTARFIDYYVNGVDNGFTALPSVQLTVLAPPDSGTQGDNFMVYANAYPLPGTTYARYLLDSGGHANTRLGDGVLLDSAQAAKGPADHFTYDPADPVPTVGGNDGHTSSQARTLDQSDVEKRNDVLVYTSARLDKSLPVIGPVKVRFWAVSSARDTDFTAKLVDVHPDGYAHNVLDRIVRARYRAGKTSKPKLIKPGKAYEYEIYLGDTATLFKPGHRIRLEISSSNFPHYARNLNTGLSNETTDKMVVAHQTILHDTAHPSFVEIPLAPRSVLPN